MPRLANFGDYHFFPSFNDLVADPSSPYRYQRCMLAEIQDARDGAFGFVHLEVLDIQNTKFRLLIRTRGSLIQPNEFKVDHTIAVINPLIESDLQPYGFEEKLQVYVSDEANTRVFPKALRFVLDVNANVRLWHHQVQKLCHGCNNEVENRPMCAGCRYYYYCDKTCQTIGWREFGHKYD
ncbi:hypothetical protein CMUS01_11482 [Colletotrichum musicola]|uniref:MYND-type domain-containing protein n=1 Tax=Colletotrichum musicola TaxID=2175873 RepID=A0A8H6N604_9PEZI|nr:hypothetical protein CMUS01_11482 [Colletotrichum musicola]